MKLKGYSINIDNKDIPVIGFFSGIGSIYAITAEKSSISFIFTIKSLETFNKVIFDKKEYDRVHLINIFNLKNIKMDNALTNQLNKFKNEIKKL